MTVSGKMLNSGRSFSGIFISHFCNLFDDIVHVQFDLEKYVGKTIDKLMTDICRELGMTPDETFERGDDAGGWLCGRIRSYEGALKRNSTNGSNKTLWLLFDNCDATGLITEIRTFIEYLTTKIMTLSNFRLILLAHQDPLPAQGQFVQAPEKILQPSVDSIKPAATQFLEQFARLKGKPFPDMEKAKFRAEMILDSINDGEDFYTSLRLAFQAWQQVYFAPEA